MISVDAKIDVKTTRKILVAVSYSFFSRSMVPSKLEMKYQTGMYFYFNFSCYSI